MEIIVKILFGCTTAQDDKEKEYSIEGVVNASPYKGMVEAAGSYINIKEGEHYEAIQLGLHTIKLKKAV